MWNRHENRARLQVNVHSLITWYKDYKYSLLVNDLLMNETTQLKMLFLCRY